MPDMPRQTIRCLVNIAREQGQQDLFMVIQGDLHTFRVECILHLKHTDLTAQQRDYGSGAHCPMHV